MSIKDIFLKPSEIREFYNQSLSGVIDINDLTGTQKKQILEFAERERNEAISFINQLSIANPDLSIDYLFEINEKYKNAIFVKDLISNQGQETKNVLALPKNFEEFLKKGYEYAKVGNFTLGEWTENGFDNIIFIDIFFEHLQNSNIDSNAMEKILHLLELQTNENISNPILKKQKEINEYFLSKIHTIKNLISLISQPNEKQSPVLNEKLIIFKNNDTIKKIHEELKGYFPKKELELLKVFQGEKLTEMLLFPHNQNKFVEVFRRLKYNGLLLNTDTETKNWICSTFHFNKKGFSEPQPFNNSTVWDILNKGKGEPPKKERICIADWLPHKTHLQLSREAAREKL